jgi:phosphatidate cytidylyltransferase
MFLFIAFGLYEWAGFSGFDEPPAKFGYVAVCGSCMAALLVAPGLWIITLVAACVFWLLAFLFIVTYPAGVVFTQKRHLMAASGVLVFTSAWLGLIILKQQASGEWLVLWVLVVVWFSDIGGYFSGRAIGKRKLIPLVSPGKTWEGAFGGLAASVLAALALTWSLGWKPLFSWCLLAGGLAIISIFGDLFESAVKRAHDVKDSGNLLPGHGGILDRIDSILVVAPVFALWVLL